MRVGRRDHTHPVSQVTSRVPSTDTETLSVGVHSSGYDADDLETKLGPEELLHA
jgi:hypothetical protein